MTAYDPNWQALLQPQLAPRLFDHAPPPFVVDGAFHPQTAWWLANLCHAAYLHNAPAAAPPAGYRDALLGRHGFREVEFIDEGAIQGVLAIRGNSCALAFRGTDDPRDWLINARVDPAPWPGGGRVHQGFNEAFERIAPRLAELRRRYAGQQWLVCGHSHGAAMAVLSATLLHPTAVYGFGCPRLGDAAFGRAVEAEPLFQLVNGRDVVCALPPSMGDFEARLPGRIHRVGCGGTDQAAVDLQALVGRLAAPAHWSTPLSELADHAIVNYVAAIERLIDPPG